MKLSSREKILMGFLFFVGFLAAFYYLLLSPQLLTLQAKSSTAKLYTQDVEILKSQMDINHPIFTEYKNKQASLVQMTANLYPAIIQEKLITVLDDKFKSAGVIPESVEFLISERGAGAEADTEQVKQAKKVDLAKLKDTFVRTGNASETAAVQNYLYNNHELIATINIKTDYSRLISLITALEKDKYKILVNNLSMSRGDGPDVNCSLAISFIAVPKLFEEGDAEYMKWTLSSGKNKYNPFIANANLSVGESAPSPVITTPLPDTTTIPTPTPVSNTPEASPPAPSKTSDFAITLRPISSDIPTVLVGKVNDKGAGAYVYADNPGFENVEVQIIEMEGKLYYRYKTSRDSYPSNYSEMTEFTAKTTGVIIEVISTKRTGKDDKSGINLTVINQSTKKVTVSIKNDDSSRSRVKMGSSTGSVAVKK